MSPLFGKKKNAEKTVVILDIENGSVASALARLSPVSPPKVFGEMRKTIPLSHARNAASLAEDVHSALREVLSHAGDVAARLRAHPSAGEIGEVNRVVAFLHAPWVSLAIPSFAQVSVDAPETFLESLRASTQGVFAQLPISFKAFSAAATPLIPGLFDAPEDMLVCTVSGEVVEISVIHRGVLLSHATIPIGLHTLLRTLVSHGGLSEAEARSALALVRHGRLPGAPEWQEALSSGKKYFLSELTDALHTVVPNNTSLGVARGILVVAPHLTAEWFAQALAQDESLADMFPEGSTVRAVHARHAVPYVAAHAAVPDLALLLEALSIDAGQGGI